MSAYSSIRVRLQNFGQAVSRFAREPRGAVAIISAFLAVVMVGLTGLAIDFGLGVMQRSKLDIAAQAAATSGANAARNLLQLNMSQNTQFDAPALAEGERVAYEVFDGQLGVASRLNVTTKYVVMARVGNTVSAQFDFEATYVPYFAQMFNINEITLKGSGSIIMGLVDNPPSSKLLEEVWIGATTPSPVMALQVGGYRDWQVQDQPARLAPTDDRRAGLASVGVGMDSNNAIAKKVYMPAGVYELRYWYKSGVIYPEYQPAYICDPSLNNISWATSDKWRDPSSSVVTNNSPQSSRVAVFLHPVKEDPRLAVAPPAVNAYTNRIDTCIYSGRWIERSISLEITNSGYFWLAFVGEAPPTSSKKGAWIGSVKLCIASCNEPIPNNFPYALDDVIFRDEFSTPVVTADRLWSKTTGGFLSTAKYEVVPSTAWVVDSTVWNVPNPPPNSIFLSRAGPLLSGQYLLITSNQRATRRMLLAPGRYQILYAIRSDGNSNICPLVAFERLGNRGGNMRCYTGTFPPIWQHYGICLTMAATNFVVVGGEIFGISPGGALRFDQFQVAAGYPGYVYQGQQNIPNFCYGNLEGATGSEELGGRVALRLDRVNVTPPAWR